MQAVLLDTCAAVWIAENEKLAPEAVAALREVRQAGLPTYVSPVTAWEIGMLASRARLKLLLTPLLWFGRLLDIPNVHLAEMSTDLLIASSFLPGKPPRDPFDRIIAATARNYGCILLTRDRALLDYGEQGHVRVVAC
jgi:PIN domain nuclease of toxin-antitoxin system